MLNELVVADRADAEKLARSLKPTAEFQGLDLHTLDSTALEALYSVVTETDDPEIFGDDSLLFELSDGGPWVELIPPEFTELLAALGEKEVLAAAKKWSRTEELIWGGWPEETVADYLRVIVSLACNAVEQGKQLLLRTCL